MTAEVLLMNHSAIALAADSAVSIGENASKIYTSAEKLFQLSSAAPIGIMIYGNANFTGVPWETIIKSYRSKLGDKTFKTLDEYVSHFIEYLSSNKKMISPDLADNSVYDLTVSLFCEILEFTRAFLTEIAEHQDGLTEPDVQNIFDAVTTSYLESIRSNEKLDNYRRDWSKRVRKKYSGHISEIRDSLFGNLPLTVATKRRLITIMIEYLCRSDFGDYRSGVVFAGYGDDEYLPSSRSYFFEGMLLGAPRIKCEQKIVLNSSEKSTVRPFAQLDMVYSFMQGISMTLNKHIQESTLNGFEELIQLILPEIEKVDAKVYKKMKQRIDSEVPNILNNLFSSWAQEQESYWRPVVQIVSVLPKDELAIMAENLVNLTKFRRRVTTDSETVGGPIDIAIITKGDGFVWFRRKHYFDSKLNPRAITRMQGV